MSSQERYDWDAVFIEAASIAHGCKTKRELASALKIPRRTLGEAMRRRGLTLLDLQVGNPSTVSGQSTLEKLRLQKQALQRDHDVLAKELGRREWWREILAEVASTLTPAYVKPPSVTSKAERSQTGLLLVSDVHLGQLTPSEQVGMFGEYNSRIALARFEYTFKSFTSIALHQPFGIDEVVVVFLGDLMEHSHLRTGHEGFVDMNTVKQCLSIANAGIASISMLAGQFPRVRIECVPGNHGRVTADYKLCDPTDNFDYLAYHIMQMGLAGQPNVTFDIPETWYVNFRVYQHIFFAMHGENIRSYSGFPWYGATRAIRKYVAMFRLTQKRMIRDRDPQTREDWEECMIVPDYALLAHFHSDTTWDAPDIESFVNGSVPGISKYGAKAVMTMNRPRQRMMFVHPKYGVTIRCPIDLDEVE